MVRGRKKDMTIPVSRTIALQRDYRERKAKYVAELEAKCKSLEEQNARLIEEVQELRKIINRREHDPGPGSELFECAEVKKEAFGDVIKSLSAAMTSIQNFQHFAEGQASSPLLSTSSSTPSDSVTSSSSLSSGVSSTSTPYSAYRMQPSDTCHRSAGGSLNFSPSVDGYASNHSNATPSPSPSFGDTTGSQSSYQHTGGASGNTYTSNYWDDPSSQSMNYFNSDKPHMRDHHSESVPPRDSVSHVHAAKALSNLSSDVLANFSPFRRSSAIYTTPTPNESLSGYAGNMVPAGQPSHMRSTMYGGGYGMSTSTRNSSGETYMPTSG